MAYFRSEVNIYSTNNSPLNKRENSAQVYLVGAGPGAVDLLTLRAAKLLGAAKYVFYDALVSPEILQLCSDAKLIAVGKRCGKISIPQDEINQQLIQTAFAAAKLGAYVVRLKGGDPMLFGRAEEEISALEQHSINVTVVPGITSALAASATLKLSLTQRNIARSVAFLTLATADSSNMELPTAVDSLVIYMGKKQAVKIAKRLLSEPPFWSSTTPVVLVASVSTLYEKYQALTLADLACGVADGFLASDEPMLILVGAAFEKKLQQKNFAKVLSEAIDL